MSEPEVLLQRLISTELSGLQVWYYAEVCYTPATNFVDGVQFTSSAESTVLNSVLDTHRRLFTGNRWA
jgi:hypothetical protein